MCVCHDAIDDCSVAGGIHIILATLIAAVRVAWMVRMVGRARGHASVGASTRNLTGATLAMVVHLVLLGL